MTTALPDNKYAYSISISEFDDLGSFVMFGMAKSIKRGSGWARIELDIQVEKTTFWPNLN